MQTNLSITIANSQKGKKARRQEGKKARRQEGKKADDILRSCVHCGFCLATCPTYHVFGNELDSPRGSIYLIKSALEDNAFSTENIKHLDCCLTCRACETTCPSGVEYGQKLSHLVETLLSKLGYQLQPVNDAHLCCGSAGTYSLFEPKTASQLRDNKLANLTDSDPELIVTSNIGCQMHLAKASKLPVMHWIELFDG